MKKVAKPQVCIHMHSGQRIWIDKDKQGAVEQQMADSSIRFIKVAGRSINTNSMAGIFLPEDYDNKEDGDIWKREMPELS